MTRTTDADADAQGDTGADHAAPTDRARAEVRPAEAEPFPSAPTEDLDASRRHGLVVLGLGTLGLAVVRAVLATRVEALTSLPDEIGFLGDAWTLGRSGPAPPMAWSPFYPGGYPLLLAPVAAATNDPATVATAARVLNVLFVAGLAPVMWLLLGRLGRMPAVARALVAVASTALPGLWVATTIVWPDALAALLWPVALLALGALARPGPMLGRIWFGPAIAYLWLVHVRFLPVLVFGAAAVVLRLVAPSRESGGDSRARLVDGANLVLGAAVLGAGIAVNRHLEGRWDIVADGPFVALGDDPLGAVGPALRSWVGQSWYALVATCGLAGIGAATLGRVAWWARDRPRALWTEPVPLVATMTLLGALGVQLAAAIQLRDARGFGDDLSFDLVANGRYQEVVLVPLVAVGLARVVRRVGASLALEARTGAIAVVLAVAVTAVVGADPPVIDAATSAGTTWARGLWAGRPTVVPTLVLLMALATFVVIRTIGATPSEGAHHRTRPDGWRVALLPAVVLMAFAAVGIERADDVVDRSRSTLAGAIELGEVREELDGRPVAYALDDSTLRWSFALGWELAPQGVVTYRSGRRPPLPMVIAPIGPDDEPAVDGLTGAELRTTIAGTAVDGRPLGLWYAAS